MNYLIGPVGLTIHTLGEIMVASTALSVHHRFKEEHRVDKAVLRAMSSEQFFGVLGLVLIIIGWSMEIFTHFVPGVKF